MAALVQPAKEASSAPPSVDTGSADPSLAAPATPALTRLFGGCSGGPCPTVYKDSSGDYVIQGYKVEPSGRSGAIVPDHEDVVRIPKAFLDQYVQSRTGVAEA